MIVKKFGVYWLASCYAMTIFVSAFLVFQVQPVISKVILPWFGGAPAVWTTCLLFFQVLLFLGYAYAHVVTRWARPAHQGLIHLGLLLAAMCLLPITPGAEWKPADSSYPTVRILLLLFVNVGMPYFLLSSTGPLLQAWFARTCQGRSPYRLYALSNAGSLLALLTYPFLFEPVLTTNMQGQFWTVGFCVFALACGYLAVRLWQMPKGVGQAAPDSLAHGEAATAIHGQNDPGVPAPGWSQYAWWLTLPAFASAMLLATTNQVCQDVAVVPFLWVIPLSLYLVSFIICFDHERWYSRFWFSSAAVMVILAGSAVADCGGDVSLTIETGLYFAFLFFVCMICHGELVRRKPAARFLTAFYLMCSAGGALGGIFVAVVCPLIFSAYWETPIGLIVAYVAAVAVLVPELRRRFGGRDGRMFGGAADKNSPPLTLPSPSLSRCADGGESAVESAARLNRTAAPESGLPPGPSQREATGTGAEQDAIGRFPASAWLTAVSAVLFAGFLTVVWSQLRSVYTGSEVSVRNFYGVLHVNRLEGRDGVPERRELVHGRIVHGLQFAAEDRRGVPTAYYSPSSGVGIVMRRYRQAAPLRVGLVGLGVGTLAAYGRPGDEFRFYEINPDVIRLAQRHFTFLSDTPAACEMVLGDARLSLEREAGQHFDILVLDAFSGDAIPVHLLTREAFVLYQRHLKPDGVLAVNISNRHLNLVPVLAGLARHFHYDRLEVRSRADRPRGATAAHWIVLTRNTRFLNDEIVRSAALGEEGQYAGLPIWTDDFNNLLSVLK